MDEQEVAQLVADVLRHSSSRADCPAIIQITNSGAEVQLLAVPGRKFKLTVEPVQ